MRRTRRSSLSVTKKLDWFPDRKEYLSLQKTTSPVPQLVLAVFGTWFNVDTIDYKDPQSLVSLGGTVVAELVQRGMEAEDIADLLTHILADWTPDTAMAFVNASDVDWLADPVALAKLKLILQEMTNLARRMADPNDSGLSVVAD